jgi:hypothetical protein
MRIQGASEDADHAHSRAVVTVARPEPPSALTITGDNVVATVHLAGDGPLTVAVVELQPAARRATTTTSSPVIQSCLFIGVAQARARFFVTNGSVNL